MEDRIVGVAEAARRINRNPRWLAAMCREGRSPLPCVRSGKSWEFRESDIAKYIKEMFGGDENADGDRVQVS